MNLLVVLDHGILMHAKTYAYNFNHISQIAAVLLEGEAGLSIIICAR